jgi:hypothetical protein
VCQHDFTLSSFHKDRILEVIDGRPMSLSNIMHLASPELDINSHREDTSIFVTKLGNYPLILGFPWLRHYDVSVSFAKNMVTFNSPFCTLHCNFPSYFPISTTPNVPPCQPSPISAIRTVSFYGLHYQEMLKVHSTFVYDLNTAPIAQFCSNIDLATIVPPEYHEFLPIFEEAQANVLPTHRPYDHIISLKPNFIPLFGPLYSMSHNELLALSKYLDEYLSKGFIHQSSSPAGCDNPYVTYIIFIT